MYLRPRVVTYGGEPDVVRYIGAMYNVYSGHPCDPREGRHVDFTRKSHMEDSYGLEFIDMDLRNAYGS